MPRERKVDHHQWISEVPVPHGVPLPVPLPVPLAVPLAVPVQTTAASTLAAEQAKAQAAFLQQRALKDEMVASKKHRELYVGNLNPGVHSTPAMKRFFEESLQKTYEGNNSIVKPFVVSINMHSGGRYCFVELSSVQIRDLCLALDGIALLGSNLKIGKPAEKRKM